jgi:hypothetical protein
VLRDQHATERCIDSGGVAAYWYEQCQVVRLRGASAQFILHAARTPDAPIEHPARERWRASRLPSVPSALRGLDPRHALPNA